MGHLRHLGHWRYWRHSGQEERRFVASELVENFEEMGHLRHLGHAGPHEMRNEHEQASSERETSTRASNDVSCFSSVSFSFLI